MGSTPTNSTTTTVVNPVVAAIGAVATDIGAAAVTFGALNNTEASAIVTCVVGIASAAFVIANALHHRANNA